MTIIKQSNLNAVLEAAQSKIDEMVAYFIASFTEENGTAPKKFEIEDYTIGLVIDFVRAFGRYIKATDAVELISVDLTRGGVLSFHVIVTRDGVTEHLSTQMIIAWGMVNRRHYRYIVSSRLRLLDQLHPAVAALMAERKKMSKIERLTADLNRTTKYWNERVEGYQIAINRTDAEIIATKPWLTNPSWRTWTGSENQVGNFGTEENFNAKWAEDDAKEVRKHRDQYTEKGLIALKKMAAKAIAKAEKKIADLN